MTSTRPQPCFANPSAKAEAGTRATTRPSLATLVCLLAVAGCGRDQDQRSAGRHEGPEEHAGQVIPAHKPKDFPSAVRRLRELNGQIASRLADGKAGSLVAEKTLPIGLDIANWLPEIAAGCDMPEPPWNEVNDRFATLVAGYQKIMAGEATDDHPADAPPLAIEASTNIKAIETLIDSADPRWFNSAMPGAK